MDEKAIQIMLDAIATTRERLIGDKQARLQFLKKIGVDVNKKIKSTKKLKDA